MKHLFFIILIIALYSCHNPDKKMEINDAKLITTGLLKTIQKKEYENIKSFYSDDFFKNTTENQWIDLLKQFDQKIGKIVSFEVINTEIINENDGLLITLVYKVKREFHDSEETLQVMHKSNSAQIVTHHVKI